MTEADGFDRACFEPGYEVTVGPEFPGDGHWAASAYAYDDQGLVQPDFVSRWGAPCVVHVRPTGSPEWVGCFPAGGLGGVSGVYATPASAGLCVLVEGNAYIVRVDAPAEGAVVAHGPVKQVVPAVAPALLLLVRDCDMVALGSAGVAWRSPRLAKDGLRIVAVDKGGIRCTGDLLTGEPGSIDVDPANGQALG